MLFLIVQDSENSLYRNPAEGLVMMIIVMRAYTWASLRPLLHANIR